MAIPTPSSFWKLDNENDYFGSRTLTNTWTVTFSAGKIGNWANFDGTNKRLWLSNSAWLTSWWSFTWAFWVKPNATTGYLLDICDSTYWKRVIIYWDTGNRVSLWVGWNTRTSTATISTGTYALIRITKSWSTYELFVNEVSQGTVSMGAGTTTQNYFSIWSAGDSFGGNSNWQIDAFWLWNVVLSTGEWAEFYNSWVWIEPPFVSDIINPEILLNFLT